MHKNGNGFLCNFHELELFRKKRLTNALVERIMGAEMLNERFATTATPMRTMGRKRTMEIKGVKKATGDYNKINEGGYIRKLYGDLMLDRETGDLWVDEYASATSYKRYDASSIITLFPRHRPDADADKVTMAEVKAAAQRACDEWNDVPTERTLYVVQEESRGDIEPWFVTYDKVMAEVNALLCWNHLTPSERKKARVYVEVYKILAPGKERPEQAWHRLLDEDDDSLKNPVDVLFEQSDEVEGGDDD